MNIGAANNGFMMLSSKDPVEKVVAWYSSRIHVTERTVAMGATILTGKKAVVTITSSGNGTSILVAQGSDSDN